MEPNTREWRGGREGGTNLLILALPLAALGGAFLLSPWARAEFGGLRSLSFWACLILAPLPSRVWWRWPAFAAILGALLALLVGAPSWRPALDLALGGAIVLSALRLALDGARSLREPPRLRLTPDAIEGVALGRGWRAPYGEIRKVSEDARRGGTLRLVPKHGREIRLDGWSLAGADPEEVAELVRAHLAQID